MADSLRKGMYTLWWTDKGTGRVRVSFADNRETLDKRYTRVWHADIVAELYAPDNTRLQPKLVEEEEKPKKTPRQKKAKKPARAKKAQVGATVSGAVMA